MGVDEEKEAKKAADDKYAAQQSKMAAEQLRKMRDMQIGAPGAPNPPAQPSALQQFLGIFKSKKLLKQAAEEK